MIFATQDAVISGIVPFDGVWHCFLFCNQLMSSSHQPIADEMMVSMDTINYICCCYRDITITLMSSARRPHVKWSDNNSHEGKIENKITKMMDVTDGT